MAFYAAANDLGSTASGTAKQVYLDKARDALRDMSQWLQEKQLTAFEVTHQGKSKTLQTWAKGVSLRERLRLGAEERANFRDIVNVIAGLALGSHFADRAPDYPNFPVLVTQANRKQLVTNALKMLSGGARTKDALATLDALEMLDGDRIDPERSKYAQAVLTRLKAKGTGQVLNRPELLSGPPDVEYFDSRMRLEPDLLVAVLAGLVYAGELVLAITGDKIDAGKLSVLTERSLDELTQFKHIDAPKELNVPLLRALFELLDLPSGLAQLATQGKDEPVRELLGERAKIVARVLTAGTDLPDRLTFWGQSLLREEELRDWQAKLESLKHFLEALQPYNTVGKLKNLRVTADDLAAQKRNLDVLSSIERLRELVADLGATAAYLSQAEMTLRPDHEWIKQAQSTRATILAKLGADWETQHAAEYRQTLGVLKRAYMTAYAAQHSRARLGVSERKTKGALSKDPRLTTLRALTGISLLPTSQLTAFHEKLEKLTSCTSLVESELAANPVCPHCGFRPTNEQGDLPPAANILRSLDDELDRLTESWERTLLENLQDPIIRTNLNLLQSPQRALIDIFLDKKRLPDSVSLEFVSAVQDVLSGLETIVVTTYDIETALFAGGSPATVEELRKRFDSFLTERCRGKDANKLRFTLG